MITERIQGCEGSANTLTLKQDFDTRFEARNQFERAAI